MGMVKTDILDLTFSKVPMLKPLLALMLGIIIGNTFDFTFSIYLPWSILLCFLVLIISTLKRFKGIRKTIFSVSFYLLMILLGVWIISIYKPNINIRHFSHYQAEQVVGIIADEPVYKEKTIRFPLSVSTLLDSNLNHSVEGKIMVTILRDSTLHDNFAYGDELIFKNKITETNKPLNPKEFDYKNYLTNKGIYHQVFLTSNDFKHLEHGKGNYILEKSLAIRQDLIRKFSNYIKDPEAYQIAIALIFGYRSQVESSTLDAFTNTGTIYVLSVSGLHVSLVFGFLTYMLFWLDRFRYGKITRCLIIFIAVWIYVILTGMSPPIMRAGIMISFFIVSTAFGRRQIGLNTLFASALFILIFAPQYLFDVGFQLSYVAILGILVLYPIFKEFWLPNNRWLSLIVEYCYVSIAAQLFTLPFALYYFGQFPIYFLLANLFIALPSTGIMYLGVVLALSPFDFMNNLIGKLLDWILVLSVDGLKFIASLPMSVSRGIVCDIWQVILLSIALLLLMKALNFANKRTLFWTVFSLFVLNIYTVIVHIKYNSYKGSRIYSLRSELAIAHIDRGKVTLCTTLDSLAHPTLKFSVLPDLLRYANQKDIVFVHLSNDKRSNYKLILDDQRFLIIEDKWNNLDSVKFDFVIWRKNNRNKLDDFLIANKDSKIIIDGSNSQKTIENLNKDIQNTSNSYLLKNNFAYVWEGD